VAQVLPLEQIAAVITRFVGGQKGAVRAALR